jgi:hypothetical protein
MKECRLIEERAIPKRRLAKNRNPAAGFECHIQNAAMGETVIVNCFN